MQVIEDTVNAPFADTLLLRSQRQPNELAYGFLSYNGTVQTSLTYSQLHSNAAQLAVALEQSLTKGTRVILLYPTGIEFLVAFYACLYTGILPICLPLPKNNAGLEFVLKVIRESGASLVMTCQSEMQARQRYLSIIDSACPILVSDKQPPTAQTYLPEKQQPTDIAFLQYTSGSTSSPKGIIVSHANILSTLRDLDRGFSPIQNRCMVSWLPFFHDMGLIFGLLLPMFAGFPCYMMSPLSFLQRPIRWLRAIDHFRATHSAGPNFAYQMCIEKITAQQASTLDLSSWKIALNGAEPVRAEVLQRFYQHFSSAGFAFDAFCSGYGMAEASLKISTVDLNQTPRFLTLETAALALGKVQPIPQNAGKGSRVLVSNGHSSINARIEIVDIEKLTSLGEGHIGEIWVQSDSIANGYWRREDDTQKTFKAHLLNGDGPFLRTGDLGFLFEGELYITGRMKDIMVIKGRNHHPEDVENSVQACHQSLRSGHCAAFSIEVEAQEELVVVAEINRRSLQSLDANTVINAIKEIVAHNHDLGVFEVVLVHPGEVSRTTSGKIQRKLCKNRYIHSELTIIERHLRSTGDAHSMAGN